MGRNARNIPSLSATFTKTKHMKPKAKEADISDLIFDDKNFNKGSEFGSGLMEKSFKQFGAGRGVLVDKNNRLIAGNKSTENFGANGGQKIIIVETDGDTLVVTKRTDIDLDTPQGREMALADNATAKANIVWAEDVIVETVGVEIAEGWGVDFAAEKPEAEDDGFDGNAPTVPVTVLGDLYEIGEHRLLCGSSTIIDTYKELFGEHLADLVVTDPPYNVAYEGKTKDALKIENDSMGDGDFYQFLYDFYTALGAYTKAGGSWYVWHADSEGAYFRRAMTDSGIKVRQCLIWVKNSMVMGRQDYQWKHEPCLYGWKEGAAHSWQSDRKQTTILEFDRPNRNAEHPTMKPIPLIAYQIDNSSKAGDIVADGFLGSGTTMVASHQLNRKCYGMELDPKYCDVIVARMVKLDESLTIKRNGEELSKEEVDLIVKKVYAE